MSSKCKNNQKPTKNFQTRNNFQLRKLYLYCSRMEKHILPRGTHYLCSLFGLKKPSYLSFRTQLAEGWINCPLLSAFRKLERKKISKSEKKESSPRNCSDPRIFTEEILPMISHSFWITNRHCLSVPLKARSG